MLLCISIDHRHAALSLLELVQRELSSVSEALYNPGLARGAVVLATCNRFEAYFDVAPAALAPAAAGCPVVPPGVAAGADTAGTGAAGVVARQDSIHASLPADLRPACPEARVTTGAGVHRSHAALAKDRVDLIFASLAAATSIPIGKLYSASRLSYEDAAAEHLFEVACGLRSAVVGEAEIAGQVRRALEVSRGLGRVTGQLERLFQGALRVARSVRQRTGIQSAGRSLVRLALTMAESRIGDWQGTRVLLIGTGAYSGASLAALRDRGAKSISVYSPSGAKRATAFASSHDILPLGPEQLDDALRGSDLVIACSSAKDPLLRREQLEHTVVSGRAPFCSGFSSLSFDSGYVRQRLLIDMGLPRNIDPACAVVQGVELLDLETVARHAPVPELSEEADARRLVAEAKAEFSSLGQEDLIVPQVVALRESVQLLLRDELERLSRGGVVDPAVSAALKHFTGRLLHTPTVRLRELARAGQLRDAADAFELLFGEIAPVATTRENTATHPERVSQPSE